MFKFGVAREHEGGGGPDGGAGGGAGAGRGEAGGQPRPRPTARAGLQQDTKVITNYKNIFLYNLSLSGAARRTVPPGVTWWRGRGRGWGRRRRGV